MIFSIIPNGVRDPYRREKTSPCISLRVLDLGKVAFPRYARDVNQSLLQRFRLDLYVLLPGRFLFPVFLHPGFKAFSGSGITTGKSQRSDVAVRNRKFLAGIFGIQPDDGISERFARAPVEDVALDLAAIF